MPVVRKISSQHLEVYLTWKRKSSGRKQAESCFDGDVHEEQWRARARARYPDVGVVRSTCSGVSSRFASLRGSPVTALAQIDLSNPGHSCGTLAWTTIRNYLHFWFTDLLPASLPPLEYTPHHELPTVFCSLLLIQYLTSAQYILQHAQKVFDEQTNDLIIHASQK